VICRSGGVTESGKGDLTIGGLLPLPGRMEGQGRLRQQRDAANFVQSNSSGRWLYASPIHYGELLSRRP